MAKDTNSANLDEDGVKYYMNGQIYQKMTYKDGQLDGPWEQFYSSGQVHYEGAFKNGRPEGSLIMYYDNGQVFKKGSFKKGLKDGAWSIYDDRGEMMDEVTFKAGRSVYSLRRPYNPNSFAAVPPRIAIRSLSLRPGVRMMSSTSVLVQP